MPSEVEPTSGTLAGLVVSLTHMGPSPPPLIVTVTVTNTATSPLTLLSWNSPLDPLALQLGLLSITPSGAAVPLRLPKILVNREMPPGDESLITLQPGESQSRQLQLGEAVVSGAELFGRDGTATIRCRGQWMAAWPRQSNEMEETLPMELAIGRDTLSGPFESNSLQVSDNNQPQ